MTKEVLTILREKALEDFARNLFTDEVLNEILNSREHIPKLDESIQENPKRQAAAEI